MVCAALLVFERPTLLASWTIWRWRLSRLTRSLSMMPIWPMPAAARYRMSGEPNPPAPTTSTQAAFSFCWPSPPISFSTNWRL